MIRANDERLRQLLLGQQQVLLEVQEVLDAEQKKDDVLSAVVLSSKGDHINRIERLDPDRVFSEEAIQRCASITACVSWMRDGSKDLFLPVPCMNCVGWKSAQRCR